MEGNSRALAQAVSRALADRFDDLEIVGEGGMSVVFRGRERESGRHLAIKVLRPELGSYVNDTRFLQEGKIAASLDHPNIVPVLDTGAVDGLLYFVMPFIEGETLSARLKREGPLSQDEAVGIASDIGKALGFAHEAGYVHRDVKPSNIMISERGAMLLDFGVAKTLESATGVELTRSGISIGTPSYMSPEQAAGERGLDARSDQYSLACVVYESLVGEPPFTGPTSVVVIARHIGGDAPSLSVARPNVNPALARAVHRALSKTPADRFSSVAEFLTALRGESAVAEARRSWGRALAVVAALVLVSALSRAFMPSELDPNRIVVFPVETDLGSSEVGNQVASYIGYVLEGTAPLVWREGRDLMEAEVDIGTVSARSRRALARSAGAGYLIDGTLLRSADSATVVLRLHDVASGELVQRAGRSGPVGSSAARLAARAVGELLGAILEPDHPVDLGALADRSPVAIAQFHQGEAEYRRSRFEGALRFYEDALDSDSMFALAAVRGAQAAGWLEAPEPAARLAQQALARDSLLPERYRMLVSGIQARFAGHPDSAFARFERLRERYPDWAEAHANAGEVRYHLYPSLDDDLGETFFLRAVGFDPGLTPPRYHLAEIALRDGRLQDAEEHRRVLFSAGGDRRIALQLELMSACAGGGPDAVDWDYFLSSDETLVVSTAQAMASSERLRSCALAAAGAGLRPGGTNSWGAYQVYHGILVAERRAEDLLALIDSDRVRSNNLPARAMLMLDALALPELTAGADSAYAERIGGYRTTGSPSVWLLMHWARHRGFSDDRDALAAELIRRGDAGDREALHFRRSAEIVLALAAGPPLEAQRIVDRLVPTGLPQELVWEPWESNTVEKLAVAEALVESGDPVRASGVLGRMPSHRSIMEVWLLPEYERIRGRMVDRP